MLTKTKKNCENLKIEILKKEKMGLEIWCRGSYPQNLAWIHKVVSEKLEFTDGQQTSVP